MKKLRVLTLVAMTAIAMTATAQVTYGNDYQYKKEKSSNSSYSADNDAFQTLYLQYNMKGKDESINGFSLGYNYAIPIGNIPLFIEPGIAAQYFFRSENFSGYGESYKIKTNLFAAKIPVSVLYEFEVANGFKLDPFAGLYARFNIFGKVKYGDGESIDLFKKFEDGGLGAKRFQFGLHIGLRARFNNKFLVGINYSADLNEFAEHTKLSHIDFTLGLNF